MLNDDPLAPEDYERAKAIWKHFGIGNMRQYHDHYLLSDVLLLAFAVNLQVISHTSMQTIYMAVPCLRHFQLATFIS